MPSFSFAPVAKVVKVRSHADSNAKYNIIIPDVIGIIVINLKGEYKVAIGEDKYDIASESYSCKGVSEVYPIELTDGLVRVRYIRSEIDRADMSREMYLPFTAGCSVKGNIVRHKAANVVIFKIKKVFLDVNDDSARKAIKFYRDNYKVIRKYIIAQQIVVDEVENSVENG